jgi:hypothetical protein
LAPTAQAQQSPVESGPSGFVELVVGAARPLADEDWETFHETSLKLGLRAGALDRAPGLHFGFEVGVDYMPVDTDDSVNLGGVVYADASVHRARILGGLRVGLRPAPDLLLFSRLGAGLDYLTGERTRTAGVITLTCQHDTMGLALEAGVGIAARVAGLSAGLQVAAPLAFHDNDDDRCLIGDDYAAYDLDILFSVSAPL